MHALASFSVHVFSLWVETAALQQADVVAAVVTYVAWLDVLVCPLFISVQQATAGPVTADHVMQTLPPAAVSVFLYHIPGMKPSTQCQTVNTI